VHLGAGETARVRLDLKARDFAFYSVEAKHWLVEPGAFTLMVGEGTKVDRTSPIVP